MFTSTTVRDLDLSTVHPDPGQPRKIFDQTELRSLASSIKANGLLQPITVRADGDGWMVVAGERRYRAHQLAGLTTIRALVMEAGPIADVRVAQIIENDNRMDVTPLEQARSYQALMDQSGWTAEQLAARIGKAVHRITERTILLRLTDDLQTLLAGGNLSPTEAYELARHSSRGQTVLFRAIKAGKCKTANDLRAASAAILDAEKQVSLLGDVEPKRPTEADVKLGTAFERNIEQVAALLRSGISENQVVAAKKVNPHRASTLADLMAAMQTDLRRLELCLRETAIQAEILGTVAA